MRTYIGIDLGTSGAKLLLVSADGSILAENTQGYPVFYPRSGWSEQNPEDWFAAAMRGMKELLRGQDASAVAGISFGGQMHGLVALDKKDAVVRPAILWNDGRTEKQTAYLNEAVGRESCPLIPAISRSRALPRRRSCGCGRTSRKTLRAPLKSCCRKITSLTG